MSETTASILTRRGYADPAEARSFLEAASLGYDPFLLGDVREACESIRAAVAAGTHICVHGDYDVDGICATAVAVLYLRELGADVRWHLPSRFEEGYGVSSDTLGRFADEGVGLVLTVDCGITAVDEVADAKRRGLDVIVTDHHRPGDVLPDCPIVATRPSSYPFPELSRRAVHETSLRVRRCECRCDPKVVRKFDQHSAGFEAASSDIRVSGHSRNHTDTDSAQRLTQTTREKLTTSKHD